MAAPDLKRAFTESSGLKYEPERWNDADIPGLHDFLVEHGDAIVWFHNGRTRISFPEVVQYVNLAAPPDQQLRFAAITGHGAQLSSNCYAYAANDDGNPMHVQSHPGFFATGKQIDQTRALDVGVVVKAMEADGFIPLDRKPDGPSKDFYLVALAIDPNPWDDDFHFYRMNDDGTWSHKIGAHPATNLDGRGHIITDIETADRHGLDGHNYSLLHGYFYAPREGLHVGVPLEAREKIREYQNELTDRLHTYLEETGMNRLFKTFGFRPVPAAPG
jgi:hypothetical protein